MSTSTMELVVPETQDMARALPSETLYKLEVAGQIATEILDERIIDWTNSGWSQRQIAEELGCTRQAISQRQKRIGIESLNEWREKSPVEGGNSVAPPEVEVETSEEEIVDGEIVDDAQPTRPRVPRKPAPEGPAHHLPDVVAEDALDNLRTQVLHWFEQGLVVRELLDRKRPLEPRSDEDQKAIQREAAKMARIARRLEEMCK